MSLANSQVDLEISLLPMIHRARSTSIILSSTFRCIKVICLGDKIIIVFSCSHICFVRSIVDDGEFGDVKPAVQCALRVWSFIRCSTHVRIRERGDSVGNNW
jgi:hypothetical protein